MGTRKGYSKIAVIILSSIIFLAAVIPVLIPVARAEGLAIISTIAGNGTYGYSGDGGEATSAQLSAPYSIAVDNSGNVIVADTLNHTIRRIGTNGTISTIAGTGSFGFNGDGVAANAQLYNPSGVAVDSSGNVYIADTYNNRIRKIDADGKISTIAGMASAGFNGDNRAATTAQLRSPSGVVVDGSGNIYIADTGNYRIRKVSTDGMISTIAGRGLYGSGGDGGAATLATLAGPNGVAVDGNGNVYIADTTSNKIRMIGVDGIISTIAGTGSYGYGGDGVAATGSPLSSPNGITVDNSGNVYFADSNSNRIRKVGTDGIITTIAGTGVYGSDGDGGAAVTAQLKNPYGVALDSSGSIYVADSSNHKVRKIAPVELNGASLTGLTLSNGTMAPAFQPGILGYSVNVSKRVESITVTPVAGEGQSVVTVNGMPLSGGQAVVPLTIGTNTITVSVTAVNNLKRSYSIRVTRGSRIGTIAGTGLVGYSGDGGEAVRAQLSSPYGVAVDNNGNVYVADTYNNRIRKVDTDGNISTVAGTGMDEYSGDGGAAADAGLNCPHSVAIDSTGRIYIADTYNHVIRKIDLDGIISTIAGDGTAGFSGDGGAAASAQLDNPRGIALDGNGNIYIADNENGRIRKIGTDGIISTVAGMGFMGSMADGIPATQAFLYHPSDIAVDSTGNIYIAETDFRKIRKVDTDGMISTIAGTGDFGSSGDGGAAVQAKLGAPSGIALDSAGNLLIADSGSNKIRKIGTDGKISTVAGNGVIGASGDGRAPASAELYYPFDVAVDGIGNIYIADTNNHEVRKVAEILESSIATLSGLALSEGTLSPAFDANTILYSANVASSVGNVTVMPTVTDSQASVRVNGMPLNQGQANVKMNYGSNSIVIVVTAEDTITTKTYTIQVERELMLGDANGDGQITAADGAMITKHRTGKITLTPEQFKALDMNGDGVLDDTDLTMLSAIYNKGKK